VPRVAANNANHTFTANDAAMLTKFFN